MTMSDTPRLPAEWEIDNVIMVAWPHRHSDWAYMLEQVEECYCRLIAALASYVRVRVATHPVAVKRALQLLTQALDDELIDNVEVVPVLTNDTWTRDYGPITTIDANGRYRINDFKFNGWGLKFAADKDNCVTAALYGASDDYVNRLNFVFEGGSVESDGRGTLMTTSRCLLSPNRNGQWSQGEIERYLCRNLAVEQVLWVDHGALEGDDTDSHIDTLARFAPVRDGHGVILYVACDDPDDSHYAELQKMKLDLERMADADGVPYELVPLPWPDAIYADGGERLPATYANFLATSGAVFVPTYGQAANDAEALRVIAGAFPRHRVVGIDCLALICQHGSLHCATMQLPY